MDRNKKYIIPPLENTAPFFVYKGRTPSIDYSCRLTYGYVTKDGHRAWRYTWERNVKFQINTGVRNGEATYQKKGCLGEFFNALRPEEKQQFIKNFDKIMQAAKGDFSIEEYGEYRDIL